MKRTSFFSISVKLKWGEGKKEQNNKFLSRLWLWLWRNPECTWTTKCKQESWGSTSMRLRLTLSQMRLYVRSIYIPSKVLKLCLKPHFGSLSSWGLSHFLLNDGNDTKVIQYLVWWIIGRVKLKNNENVSPMQFLNCHGNDSWRSMPINHISDCVIIEQLHSLPTHHLWTVYQYAYIYGKKNFF